MKGKCYRSMSKSEKPHEMKMILEFIDSGSNIVFKRCSYKAGQGHCHHLSALVYAVLSSLKKSDDASACTSKPQQWHVPRGAKIDPQPWMQLTFSKPSVEKESTRGASLCLYDPRSLKRKDSEESKQINLKRYALLHQLFTWKMIVLPPLKQILVNTFRAVH